MISLSCGTGVSQVHWARIIIDEGHELGGKGLSELAKVRENGLFKHFIYLNDHFATTGSGQTEGKTQK